MFNFITTAPDNTTIASRSDRDSRFKVLFNRNGMWDSFASALTVKDADTACFELAQAWGVSASDFVIAESDAVNYTKWAVANDDYMARVRASHKVGA
jgi:hypothetical protein